MNLENAILLPYLTMFTLITDLFNLFINKNQTDIIYTYLDKALD